MQVPHIKITQAHLDAAADQMSGYELMPDFANKAIEIALAEQSQEQYITAEEARKLGAGKAEWSCEINGEHWYPCSAGHSYMAHSQITGVPIKYRALKKSEPEYDEASFLKRVEEAVPAFVPHYFGKKSEPVKPHAEQKQPDSGGWIANTGTQPVADEVEVEFMMRSEVKSCDIASSLRWDLNRNRGGDITHWRLANQEKKPEPVEPTCQVRNLDTGELKTMTREKAKLLQAETKDVCDWCHPCGEISVHAGFTDKGIYTYKRKENLVKLNGKLMSREAAIAEWESKKDTHDRYYFNYEFGTSGLCNPSDFYWDESLVYELRERPLKQISWTGSREDVIALLKELGVTNG